MSFTFGSAASRLIGDLGTGGQFTTPSFMFMRVKYTARPYAYSDILAGVQAATDTANNSRTLGTVESVNDRFNMTGTSAAGASAALSSVDESNWASTWHFIGGVFQASSRDFYFGPASGTTNAGTGDAVDGPLRYVSVGAAYNGNAYVEDNWVAEVCFGSFVPTGGQIADLRGGISPNTVFGSTSGWYYYPLNVNSASQVDAGPNAGPTLTTSGTVTWSSDHPEISSGTSLVPTASPLYYGATRLDGKTGIQWTLRTGHTGINGELLNSGVAATTDASGNIQIPAGSYGAATDPVTLSLYWEEGNPAVDRSLIVKTTLVAE